MNDELRDRIAAELHDTDCGCLLDALSADDWEYYRMLAEAVLALPEIARALRLAAAVRRTEFLLDWEGDDPMWAAAVKAHNDLLTSIRAAGDPPEVTWAHRNPDQQYCGPGCTHPDHPENRGPLDGMPYDRSHDS